MISDQLASNFITELFSYALSHKDTFEIVRAYLKFSYLQTEAEKKLWQWVVREYNKTNRIPTLGQIQQQFRNDDKILELLVDIGDTEVDDTSDGHNSLLATFEEYLKQMKFLESNDKIVEFYNRGDKEKAYDMFVKFANEMAEFSILDAEAERVFQDFEQRQVQRIIEANNLSDKISTGIDELDYILGGVNGGLEDGEFALWLGTSGAGKSQLLIHLGITAARQGKRVVHIQLEGTKKQCMNRFDAAWTGTLYHDMKLGNVSKKNLELSRKIIEKFSRNDIFVYSCEKWGGMTVADVRTRCKEIEKKYGKIDEINVDYLELLELGDGVHYTPKDEPLRQIKLSRAMKTLAMEFGAVVNAATQANDVSFEERNDPDFVFNRSNLGQSRGKIFASDFFATINFTVDERKEQIMRIFVDKAREHSGNQIIYICNAMQYSRFYDKKRTQEIDWASYKEELEDR